jgi:hypothetical protein
MDNVKSINQILEALDDIKKDIKLLMENNENNKKEDGNV